MKYMHLAFQDGGGSNKRDGTSTVAHFLYLTFVARFNATDGNVIRMECGEYYASTFLNNLLLYAEPILKKECQKGSPNKASVEIAVKASVQLPGSQVTMETRILLTESLSRTQMYVIEIK